MRRALRVIGPIIGVAFCLSLAVTTTSPAPLTTPTIAARDALLRAKMEPRVTLEPSAMLRAHEARRRVDAGSIVDPCRPAPACPATYYGSTFLSGSFEWFVWYEQGSGPAAVWTRIAKYPRAALASQHAYAVFTYDGYWLPKTFGEGEFYLLFNGSLVKAFFHPDRDQPVFIDNSQFSSEPGYEQDREFFYTRSFWYDHRHREVIVYDQAPQRDTLIHVAMEQSVDVGKLSEVLTDHHGAWAAGSDIERL